MPRAAADVPPTFKKSRRFQNESPLSTAFVSYFAQSFDRVACPAELYRAASNDTCSTERGSFESGQALPAEHPTNCRHIQATEHFGLEADSYPRLPPTGGYFRTWTHFWFPRARSRMASD